MIENILPDKNAFIKIRNVLKTYKNSDNELQAVLRVESLDLLKGKQYCLKGKSGCGKTTFLNILAGILLPDTGDIFIADQNITKLKEDQRDRFRATTIGYVFQDFNLLQGFSALENILIAMHFNNDKRLNARHDAIELLQKVGLENKINHKPSQLSFGQQQRVAIARAIANKPQIILADEPTGSLDHENTVDIITLIKHLCTDNVITLIFATHDPLLMDEFSNHIQL